MIHILEENQIFPKDRTYEECMIESIKCHHNEIFNYIKDALFDRSKSNENQVEKDEVNLNKSPLLYHNFEFIPDDLESIFKLIFYLMQNKYSTLVKLVNDQTQFFFDINDYELIKRVENSIFSSYIERDKRTSKKILIKSLNEEKYVDEFSRMMICKYPSILNIKGFSPVDIYKNKNPSILTDYFQITLFNYINEKRKRKGNSTKTNDYIIILGITIGLRHLQKNGIIHVLLYPGSILFDENLYPIIRNVERTKKITIQNEWSSCSRTS